MPEHAKGREGCGGSVHLGGGRTYECPVLLEVGTGRGQGDGPAQPPFLTSPILGCHLVAPISHLCCLIRAATLIPLLLSFTHSHTHTHTLLILSSIHPSITSPPLNRILFVFFFFLHTFILSNFTHKPNTPHKP